MKQANAIVAVVLVVAAGAGGALWGGGWVGGGGGGGRGEGRGLLPPHGGGGGGGGLNLPARFFITATRWVCRIPRRYPRRIRWGWITFRYTKNRRNRALRQAQCR